MDRDLQEALRELKERINLLLWTTLPDDTSLREAERIALAMYAPVEDYLMKCHVVDQWGGRLSTVANEKPVAPENLEVTTGMKAPQEGVDHV